MIRRDGLFLPSKDICTTTARQCPICFWASILMLYIMALFLAITSIDYPVNPEPTTIENIWLALCIKVLYIVIVAMRIIISPKEFYHTVMENPISERIDQSLAKKYHRVVITSSSNGCPIKASPANCSLFRGHHISILVSCVIFTEVFISGTRHTTGKLGTPEGTEHSKRPLGVAEEPTNNPST